MKKEEKKSALLGAVGLLLGCAILVLMIVLSLNVYSVSQETLYEAQTTINTRIDDGTAQINKTVTNTKEECNKKITDTFVEINENVENAKNDFHEKIKQSDKTTYLEFYGKIVILYIW